MGSIKIDLQLIDNNYNRSEKIRSEKGFTHNGKLFLTYLQDRILMDQSFVVLDVNDDGIHNPIRQKNINGFEMVLSGDCRFRSEGFSILHLSKETGQCKIVLYDGNCHKIKEKDLYCDIERQIVGGIFTPNDHYLVLCYYYEGNNRIDLLDSKTLDRCSSKVIDIDLFTHVKTFKLKDNKEYLVIGSYQRLEHKSTIRIYSLIKDEIVPVENSFIILNGKIHDMDLHRDDTILQTLISVGLEIDDKNIPVGRGTPIDNKRNLLFGDDRQFELHLLQFYKNNGGITPGNGYYRLRSAYKKEMSGNCTTSFHPSGSFLVVCNNINTEINNDIRSQTATQIYLPDIISIYHINTAPDNHDLPCLVIDDIPRFGPSCSKAYFDIYGQYMLIVGSSLLLDGRIPPEEEIDVRQTGPNYIHNINLYKFDYKEIPPPNETRLGINEGKETYADIAKKGNHQSHKRQEHALSRMIDDSSYESRNDNVETEYERLRMRRNRSKDYSTDNRQGVPSDFNRNDADAHTSQRDGKHINEHTSPYPNADRVSYRRPSRNDPHGYGGRYSGDLNRPKYINQHGRGVAGNPYRGNLHRDNHINDRFKNMNPGSWRDVINPNKTPLKQKTNPRPDLPENNRTPHVYKSSKKQKDTGDIFSNIFKEVIGNSGSTGDISHNNS